MSSTRTLRKIIAILQNLFQKIVGKATLPNSFYGVSISGGSDSKESACNGEDPGSIPELRRPSGEGNGYPLQYSCLENSIDREAWWVIVHSVAESDTTEQRTHTHTHTHHPIILKLAKLYKKRKLRGTEFLTHKETKISYKILSDQTQQTMNMIIYI